MANTVVVNALGSAVYLKSSGAGTSGDPHIPAHTVDSITGALPAGTNNVGDVDVLTLVGDSADLDSGAGTDSHAGVAVLLPSSGGHVVGGTPTSPLRVDTVASTVQPVSVASWYVPLINVVGSVHVGNALATVNVANVERTVTGSVHVGNFPSVQPISIASNFLPNVTASVIGNPAVVGSVHVGNWPAVQAISVASWFAGAGVVASTIGTLYAVVNTGAVGTQNTIVAGSVNVVGNIVASTVGTIFAVVNTSAAGTGNMVVNTQATVNVTGTLYAVVNTGAVGTQNAIVGGSVNVAGNVLASIPNVAAISVASWFVGAGVVASVVGNAAVTASIVGLPSVAVASITALIRPYTILSQWSKVARITASSGVAAAQAAPGANLYNVVTGLSVVNAAASYGGLVQVADGTGTLFAGYAHAAGGFVRTFLAGLKPAANATVYVNAPVYSLDLLVTIDGFVGA